MRFSQEDFQLMVQEVLHTTPSRFDTLCRIATQTLEPMVVSWCRKDPALRGRGFEQDVMQGILLHLMKTVVHGFLLNDRAAEPYNDDPEGFERWMTTVAHNYHRDFANGVRRVDFSTVSEEVLDTVVSSDEDWAVREEQQALLRRALNTVLAADVRVYKALTWLAQVLFIADQGLEHHKANALIVAMFENKTLYEMYDYILAHSKRIPWMTLSPQQHQRVMAALQKPWDDKRTYGEVEYHTFFMKYKGEFSGSKSVSDWIHRINGIACRGCLSEDSAAKSATTPSAGKKRRDEDGSSDIG